MVTNWRLNLLKFGMLALVTAFAIALSITLISSPVLAQAATTIDFGPDIEEADRHRANLRVAEAEAAYQRAYSFDGLN